MNSLEIEGGYNLKGVINPQGAKNEALQVICSVLLTNEKIIIENIPDILDVRMWLKGYILQQHLLGPIRSSDDLTDQGRTTSIEEVRYLLL